MTEQNTDVVPWMQAIGAAKHKFSQIAAHSSMDYDKESMFAMQAIVKNDYILSAAMKNPTSVRNAVINIAAVGLSLNPSTKNAYLVPRDGEICLDISYVGLIKIATDTGSIKWAKAEVVYSTDTFIYNGPSEKPTHAADVFSPDRGEMIGVYCIAKTADNEYLIETMTAAEIDDIRAKSKGADSKYSAWTNFTGEMWKKAVIKRASKTWPKTERSDRFDNAVAIVNQSEGLQEEYLSSGHQLIGTEPVDHMKIEALTQLCREIVDEDDEECGPSKAFEIIDALSNDEKMELFSKLKLSKPVDNDGKPIRKTYASCFTDHLNTYKENRRAT
jgi:recombination protein RecT